jgi:hypothetical protein
MARKQGECREDGTVNPSVAERAFRWVSVPSGSGWWKKPHEDPPRTRERRRLHALFWVALIAGCVLVWIGVQSTQISTPGCGEFQIASQLSGTSARLERAVGESSRT